MADHLSFIEPIIDENFMHYLLIMQSLAFSFLLFSFYQLRKAKKRVDANEKNSRNFAASILEHEERVLLKFANSLLSIIDETKKSEDQNYGDQHLEHLFHFTDELTPFNSSDDSLTTAIQKLVETHERKNFRISFVKTDRYIQIPKATQIIIYRIIKEALNNAKKHSYANKLFISLFFNNSAAELSVEDNGIGFDVNATSSGVGLQSISNAVAYLNGHLEIESGKNKGTLLCASIPYNT